MGFTKGSDMTEPLNNNNQVLAVARRIFNLHFGMQDLVHPREVKPGPLHREHRVVATGPPGKTPRPRLHTSPLTLHKLRLTRFNFMLLVRKSVSKAVV